MLVDDEHMDKKLLWWVFGLTTGGATRAKIVKLLHDRPANANVIAKELGFDYKAIRYHLDILVHNKILSPTGDAHITMYFLTDEMEKSYNEFLAIYKKLKI